MPRLGRAATAQTDAMKVTHRQTAGAAVQRQLPAVARRADKAETGEPRAGHTVDGQLANRTVKPQVLHHRHPGDLRQSVRPTRASRPPGRRSRTPTQIGGKGRPIIRRKATATPLRTARTIRDCGWRARKINNPRHHTGAGPRPVLFAFRLRRRNDTLHQPLGDLSTNAPEEASVSCSLTRPTR